MCPAEKPGYAGNVLRVNLTTRSTHRETVSESILRSFVGGTGLGSVYLFKEVPPGTDWADADNLLIFASGPLGGTKLAGAGSFSVVTKGPLTNGSTSTQANGYFGAFLRFSGFDSVVIQGASEDWRYLYVHDGRAELKDARHLMGKDTRETEETIKAELGMKDRQLSVFCIGPGGENRIRFAAIVGDRGHVAAHNGVGAVMGSKRLKAIVTARGQQSVPIGDRVRFSALARKMVEDAKQHPVYGSLYKWGTSFLYPIYAKTGVLPVKNLSTNIFPDADRFSGEHYRQRCEMRRDPCWACPMHHCHTMKVTEGPYAGYVGDEPEYECWAAFSSLIGQSDLGAALMLSDVTDRLGFDANETGWLLAFVMECYERGILSRHDTDGLEMRWGNVEAARELLYKIARRQGIGNVLAEGVKRAAETIGGEALRIGVYMHKGHAPRGHDHRARWTEILDYAVSGTGTIETGPVPLSDPFSVEAVAKAVAGGKIRLFVDSLVTCMFPTMAMTESKAPHLVELLNAATGWDFTDKDALRVGLRIANLLRLFNLRHGVSPEVELPSPRYCSAPVDGPLKGKSIMPYWSALLDEYYRLSGWARDTGHPLQDTLKDLGLDAFADHGKSYRQGS